MLRSSRLSTPQPRLSSTATTWTLVLWRASWKGSGRSGWMELSFMASGLRVERALQPLLSSSGWRKYRWGTTNTISSGGELTYFRWCTGIRNFFLFKKWGKFFHFSERTQELRDTLDEMGISKDFILANNEYGLNGDSSVYTDFDR